MNVTLFYRQPAYRQLAVFYLKIDKICFVMWRTRFIRGFLSRKILGKFATRETRGHWVCFVYRIVVILGYCKILSVKLGSTYKEHDCWIQHPWNYIRRCRKGKFANFGKKNISRGFNASFSTIYYWLGNISKNFDQQNIFGGMFFCFYIVTGNFEKVQKMLW